MSLKVCAIGGGSSYTPELIEGFINRYDKLPITELWLVDIEDGKEKLEIITNLAKRMIKKANLPIVVYSTIKREEGLKDADFVITQIRVGGIDARINDETICKKHGLLEQETNGPVGYFKSKRTIPVILKIAEEMLTYCPNAWLINFSNPAGIVSEALYKYSNNKKVIGLCNVPFNMHKTLADILKININDLKIDFLGLNHFVYGINIEHEGIDIKDKALKAFVENPVIPTMKNIAPIVWDYDLIKSIDAYPSPYHRYYYMHKQMLEEAKLKDKVRGEVVKEVEKELFVEYAKLDLDVKPKHLEQRGGAYYSDAACNLITSLYNDDHSIQIVNTKNNNTIVELDKDSAIEVSAKITKDGVIPISFNKINDNILYSIITVKNYEKLIIESIMENDDNKAILALSTNYFVNDYQKAKEVYNELLLTNEKLLKGV